MISIGRSVGWVLSILVFAGVALADPIEGNNIKVRVHVKNTGTQKAHMQVYEVEVVNGQRVAFTPVGQVLGVVDNDGKEYRLDVTLQYKNFRKGPNGGEIRTLLLAVNGGTYAPKPVMEGWWFNKEPKIVDGRSLWTMEVVGGK